MCWFPLWGRRRWGVWGRIAESPSHLIGAVCGGGGGGGGDWARERIKAFSSRGGSTVVVSLYSAGRVVIVPAASYGAGEIAWHRCD